MRRLALGCRAARSGVARTPPPSCEAGRVLREFPLAGRMADRVGPDGLALHEPPPVREAATVMLLRDGSAGRAGPEVFAFRRVPRMAFAPGMLVFPGRPLDPADADPALPLPRPVPRELRHVPAAAGREPLEEGGGLLDPPVPDGAAAGD